MRNLIKSIFIILITATGLHAQQRFPLNGKVVSDFDNVEGIYVINKKTELSTTTSRGGYFTINAAVNDTLIISSVQFQSIELAVTPEHFKEKLVLVPLEAINRELDELVINDYSHINAESLGLVPVGQKQYTPAERKVATASNFRMNPLGLDPIFNAFSGRTAMLKGAVEVDKKQALMEKLSYIYTEQDIISKLKIPVDYVQGFIYYVIENKHLANAINEKNDERVRFMITGLAGKYLALLNDDK